MIFSLGWSPPALSLFATLPKHVHVWRASLVSPRLLSLSDHVLTDQEKRRAASIDSVKQRQRFKATRACVRDVLSRYLQNTQPQDILFDRTERGKPFVVYPSTDIHFNIAHTADVLLLAVALVKVGVDIERRDRPLFNISRLLRSRLSQNERTQIQQFSFSRNLSPQERDEYVRESFLKLWIRKEAFVKSTGDGIAKGFGEIEILESTAGLIVQDVSSGRSLSDYCLMDLHLDSAHFGAVGLTSGEPHEIVVMPYSFGIVQT